jgi:hypothetical protein
MRPAMSLKSILLGIAVVAVSFFVSLKTMDWLAARRAVPGPVIAELPPLPAAARVSTIMAPVAISIAAIRDAADRSAPRNFAGKATNPVSQVLQNADIGWTASRGPIQAAGAQDVLSLTMPLTGKLNVTGSLSSKATGAVGDAIGGILGNDAGKQIGSINIKSLNASAEIKGNVTFTSRPKFAQTWHLEPNLMGQVALGDSSLIVAGARVNVPAQVKPLIDKNIADQIAAAETRIQNDRTFEQAARAQWANACRSIPLQIAGGSSLPPLWLEIKPTGALAAQPHVDASAVTTTIGIEAETRITSTETKPDCPFPGRLVIVPPTAGGIYIGVPIDLSFTEISGLVAAQFAGRTFPEDGSGPVELTVKGATVAPSGDRLLISLLVHAKEKKSFFGFGGEAMVHIWGRPLLDDSHQILRLENVELAVESEAAFGLLGAAARAVVPHLQKVLAEKTTIDLKPFAANAQQKIAAVIADFQRSDNGVRVTAHIDTLRLADIAFDSKTLRIITVAQGSMNAVVTALPGL